MSDIKTWIIMGLVVSMSIIAGNNFYVLLSGQYGLNPVQVSGSNKTAELMEDLQTTQEELAGTMDDVTDFGVFTNALRAAGTVINMFLNSFSLFTEMITSFIGSIPAIGLFADYIVGTLYGIIITMIAFFVLKIIFGGRI